MKRILTFCTIAFLISSCQPKNLPTISDIHSDYAEVKISHMTTKTELNEIKTKLKTISNIDLIYDQSQFFEDGKIQNLKIGVIMPDGTEGSGSADLLNLQFKYYGFEYNSKGNPSFKIGAI